MSTHDNVVVGRPVSSDLEKLRHNVRLDRVGYVAVEQLKLHHRRLRKRKDTYLAAMKASVGAFGIVLPLLIDENDVVIAGEGALAAAKSLGYNEVPVLRVEHLDAAQVQLLRIALNKMSDHSEWDRLELRAEFSDLLSVDIDVALEVTGFSTVEIDNLVFSPVDGEDSVEADDEPVAIGAPGTAVSQPGDMWDLDEHVVLCGSSLELENLARLMDGKSARMVLTDHPFNLRVASLGGLGKHQHREFPQASGEMTEAEFIAFLTQSMKTLAASCVDGALMYMYMDWRHQWEILSAMRVAGLDMINLAVWVKHSGGMGSFYRSQHELVYIVRKGSTNHLNNVQLGRFGRNRTNCWKYPGVNSFGNGRDDLLAMHPTCKNVTMLSDAIRDASNRGEIVLDGFLGSGSTLIAAERTGRVCRGVELDPLYVDAIVKRWEKVTGGSATLRGTGETFAAVARRRADAMDAADTAQTAHAPVVARVRVRASA